MADRVQVTIRPQTDEHERLKAAHRQSFAEHGKPFGAWVIAVLLGEAQRIENLTAVREEAPKKRGR